MEPVAPRKRILRMKVERIRTSASVVLLGAFDTQAFLLEKLREAALLSPSDLATARCDELLPGQVLTLRFGSWGRLNVLSERWTFEVLEAPFIRASDFTLRCLRELAPSSTVRVMGLNAQADFRFLDPVERDAVGRRLVPVAGWGSWGRELARLMDEIPPDKAGHPGAVSAALRLPNPRQRAHGYLDIRWEALDIKGPPPALGMRLLSNDHYTPRDSGAPLSDSVLTATLLDTLGQEFDTSIQGALEIFEDILKDESS